MLNIYDMYKQMENEEIILAFRGNISEELLTSVFQIIETRMDMSPAELRLKKKVNNILVECLQNVYHHMEDFTEEEKKNNDTGSAMFLVCKDGTGSYRIVTGNYILNSNVMKLQNRIDEINSMSKEELKTHYLESLTKTELSTKGGAGLGMIDMARKSGQKLDYRFDPLNDRISFFSLMIQID
jgi:hypothetical protein